MKIIKVKCWIIDIIGHHSASIVAITALLIKDIYIMIIEPAERAENTTMWNWWIKRHIGNQLLYRALSGRQSTQDGVCSTHTILEKAIILMFHICVLFPMKFVEKNRDSFLPFKLEYFLFIDQIQGQNKQQRDKK